MKIIKHGIYYNDPSILKTCSNCNCEFRFDLDDVEKYKKPVKCYFTIAYEYDYTVKARYYVECPDCGRQVNVFDEDFCLLKNLKRSSNKIGDIDDRIDYFLSWFEKELHNKNSSLFNHSVAYHTACRILKEGVKDEFRY